MDISKISGAQKLTPCVDAVDAAKRIGATGLSALLLYSQEWLATQLSQLVSQRRAYNPVLFHRHNGKPTIYKYHFPMHVLYLCNTKGRQCCWSSSFVQSIVFTTCHPSSLFSGSILNSEADNFVLIHFVSSKQVNNVQLFGCQRSIFNKAALQFVNGYVLVSWCMF